MAINQTIASMSLRILIGAVLSSVMIISLLILSRDLHVYLERFENSDLLQFCIFGLLLLSAGAGLLLLFRKRRGAKIELDMAGVSITTLLSFDFYSLGVKFLEGFINGALKDTAIINKNVSDQIIVKRK